MWDKKKTVLERKNQVSLLEEYKKREKGVFALYINCKSINYEIKELIRKKEYKDYSSAIFSLSNDSECISQFVSNLIYMSISQYNDLTFSEKTEKVCLSEEFHLKTKDGDLQLDNDELREIIFDNVMKNIQKDLSKVSEAFISGEYNYFLKEIKDSDLKSLICFIKKNIIDNSDVHELLKLKIEDSIKKWKSHKIEDFTFENGDTAYLLDFSLDLESIIENKSFFNVLEIKLKKKKLTINGEYISFEPLKEHRHLPETTISNPYRGDIEVYTGRNNYFCYSKEEALALGKEKVEALKKSIKAFEEVEF